MSRISKALHKPAHLRGKGTRRREPLGRRNVGARGLTAAVVILLWAALILLGDNDLTSAASTKGVSADVASDRAALVALYNATDGANWDDNDDWLSDEPLKYGNYILD